MINHGSGDVAREEKLRDGCIAIVGLIVREADGDALMMLHHNPADAGVCSRLVHGCDSILLRLFLLFVALAFLDLFEVGLEGFITDRIITYQRAIEAKEVVNHLGRAA